MRKTNMDMHLTLNLSSEVLGPEQVTNGDFSTGNGGSGDFSGWKQRDIHPYETFNADGSNLNCVNTVAFGVMGCSGLTLTEGKTYKMAFDWILNSGTSPTLQIRTNGAAGTPFQTITPAVGATGAKSYTFTVTGNSGNFISWTTGNGVATNFTLDNVSVKQIF